MRSHKPRIKVISTGGTIASADFETGKRPAHGVTELLRRVPYISEHFAVEKTQLFGKGKDSTLIGYSDWRKMVKEAFDPLMRGNPVLILHGTDTMAYTGAALPFMLQKPRAPVILTGSMRTPDEPDSDVVRNLEDSARFALVAAPGFYVVFNGKVMNSARVTKVHSSSLDAFDTVDSRYIAKIQNGKVIGYMKPKQIDAQAEVALNTSLYDKKVFTLKVTPGLPPSVLDMIRRAGFMGIVIEGFGLGGVPFVTGAYGTNVVGGFLYKAMEVAADIPIVLTTQTVHGGVNLSEYEVGKKIENSRIISGEDMTSEAAAVKLMWCLGQEMTLNQITKAFKRSYVGEVTFKLGAKG